VWIGHGDACDARSDEIGWSQVFDDRTLKPARAQHADAIRGCRIRPRGCLLFMRAAVGAADTVDRIQGCENDKYPNGGEPAHLSIIWNGPRSLTRRARSSILEGVRLVHRLSALLLCLGLAAGNVAICAGWAATPEERMACCAEGGECPMHKREAHESQESTSGRHVLTQVEADACCVSSEREQSSPSSPTFVAAISVAVLGPGVVLPATVPALVLSDAWRTASPIPTPPVPKHVLLSVFLV
jgi:hypothetical protein